MTSIKFAIVQLNPTVGALEDNYNKHIRFIDEAAQNGAEFVIFPEMSLTGYPLEDLVLRSSFIEAAETHTANLITWIKTNHPQLGVVFGSPRFSPGHQTVHNSAFYTGTSDQIIDKVELPNYGVFDEKRVFRAGGEPYPIDFRGYKLGVMICEDCWFPNVSRRLHENGATMLISINGSPFEIGKNLVRKKTIRDRVEETGLPFMYVNMVGGQDELVFDGGSFYWDGERTIDCEEFREDITYIDVQLNEKTSHYRDNKRIANWNDDGSFGGWNTTFGGISTDKYALPTPSSIPQIYQTLVMGLRDYLHKQKKADGESLFKSVVIGYSGGVDSGIVAAIASDAIGPQNVHLVRLPSKYSSQGSLDDAAEGARRLTCPLRTIEIEPAVDALRAAYRNAEGENVIWRELTGISDENIQARARGTILMSISNQEGHMLLTTGNKTENSVGYSTLYGDANGGFNPIKDIYKTTVWDLCRWRNGLTENQLHEYGFLGQSTEVVPEEIIIKPPSAELRPDQKDQDSLPPYDVLDSILKNMIEREKSIQEIVNEGFDLQTVTRVRNLVDNAEYKRRQAAPGSKVTSKIYGRDRRYPIVNLWRG